MADDLAVYETIAAAVAEAREPDFSSFDGAEVRLAMQRALPFPPVHELTSSTGWRGG